ncbi:MAG: hypothetical protein M3387_00420 [Actinomycetota bacterium]|nr:hypothetical protein [Actinomycetota bacterium]
MRRLLVLAFTCLRLLGMLPAGAAPTPVVAKNLELVTTIPDVGAISTAFSSTKPLMYVNTLNGVRIYDISNPESPQLVSQLPLPHFENERMTMGERAGGTKFLLIGLDLYGIGADPSDSPNVGGYELVIVDVTNPAKRVRSRLAASTSVHTVHCHGTTTSRARSGTRAWAASRPTTSATRSTPSR